MAKIIPFRTITASDLSQRAQEYAEEMVRVIEEFDRQHPFPAGWTQTDEERFRIVSAQLTHPTREEMKATFAELFCLSMADSHVIVPDRQRRPRKK